MVNEIRAAYLKLSARKRWLIEVGVAGLFLLLLGLIGAAISPYSPTQSHAFYNEGAANQEVVRATIEQVSDTSLEARIKDGPLIGKIVPVEYDTETQRGQMSSGDEILLAKSTEDSSFSFIDQFRIPFLIFLVGVFIAVVALVGRTKGLRSIGGLLASILIITFLLIPMVKAGFDTFTACIISAALIAVSTITVSHGINRRAVAILISMVSILLFVALIGWLVVTTLGLTGIVDEATYYISVLNSTIDIDGLITGGMVIATVGALDDIVTTQIAAVYELRKTDRRLKQASLFKKASRIGAEHIASLVNTLAMVYVGAALPIIVILSINTPDMLLLANSEVIATEVARTMVISIALVLAVPLSTWIGVKSSEMTAKRKY